jgi:hypothetical protein
MKVIQLAIERGQDVDGIEITCLWALTDDGRIWVQIRGEWVEQEGPPGTLKPRKREAQ